MKWGQIIWAALSNLPDFIRLIGKGWALKKEFEDLTGLSVTEIVGKALAGAKDAIPAPQEIKPGSVEEQIWFDRNTNPAN